MENQQNNQRLLTVSNNLFMERTGYFPDISTLQAKTIEAPSDSKENFEISFCNEKLKEISNQADATKIPSSARKLGHESKLFKTTKNQTNTATVVKTKSITSEYSKGNSNGNGAKIAANAKKNCKPDESKNYLKNECKVVVDETVNQNQRIVKRSSSSNYITANKSSSGIFAAKKMNKNWNNVQINNTNLKTERGASSGKTNLNTKNKTNIKYQNSGIQLDLNNLIEYCNNPELIKKEPIILKKLDNILDHLTDIKNVIKDNSKKKSGNTIYFKFLVHEYKTQNIRIDDVKPLGSLMRVVKTTRSDRNNISNNRTNDI